MPTCLQVNNGKASPALSIRDAGEKYECDTVAKLRPARKAICYWAFDGATIVAGQFGCAGHPLAWAGTGLPVVASFEEDLS